MTESIWGGTAAPHPSADQTWTIDGTVGGSEAGTFAITVKVAGGSSATADVAFNANAGTIQTAVRLLAGVDDAVVTGGVLGTAPIVVKFPTGPVDVSVSGDNFTDTSTVTVELTSEGHNAAGNVTVLNPTGATRVDGTVTRPPYSRKFGAKETPAEVYKNPDGSTITTGGGVTAVAP